MFKKFSVGVVSNVIHQMYHGLMPRIRAGASGHQLDLITLTALSAVVVLLWLPFGWNVSGLTDEWVLIGEFTGSNFSLDLSSLRPFVTAFQHLGYLLTPNSHVGINIVFAALLLARGFALYLAIGELLPSARVVASASALLYTVFYADLGWFWLGTHSIAWSGLWTFVAIWLLLRQFRRSARWLWVAMGISQALAMTYEAAFPIIFAAPILLPLVAGRFNRRVWITAGLWYIVPITLLTRYGIVVATQNQLYQSGQFTTALSTESPLRDMANSMFRIYKRLLGGAFLDRYTYWRETLPFLPYAGAISGVSVGAVWYSLRRQPPVLRWREVVTASLAGFALIGLGFAGYLVSEYRDVDYRVYYFSAAGSALIIGMALLIVSYGGKWVRRATAAGALIVALIIAPRLGKLALSVGGLLALVVPARWLFLLGFGVLMGGHASFTLWQHSLYAEAPRGQHWILSAIIEQAPRPADGTLIVLLDESPEGRAMLEFENRRDMLIGAVRYLYANPTLDAAFCVPGAETFGYFREACAFTENGFYIRWTKFVLSERTIPYENLVVFTFDEEQGARLLDQLPVPAAGYEPASITGVGESLPPRADSALYDFPTEKPDAPVNWGLLH